MKEPDASQLVEFIGMAFGLVTVALILKHADDFSQILQGLRDLPETSVETRTRAERDAAFAEALVRRDEAPQKSWTPPAASFSPLGSRPVQRQRRGRRDSAAAIQRQEHGWWLD